MKVSFLGRTVLLLGALTASTWLTLAKVGDLISANLVEIGENIGRKEVTELIQKAVSEVVDPDSDDFLTREEDVFSYDTAHLNEVLKETTAAVNRGLKASLNSKTRGGNPAYVFKVPLGLAYGNPLLVGFGPDLPVSYQLVGDFTSRLLSQVDSFGLNNAMVKIILAIDFQTSLVLPLTTARHRFSYEAPLYLTVVKGEVPFTLPAGEVSGVGAITGSYSSL